MTLVPADWSEHDQVDWRAWTIEWTIHDKVISGPIRRYEDFTVSLLLVVWLLDLQSIRIPLNNTKLEKDEEDGRMYFSVTEGGSDSHYCLVPPIAKAASSD